MKGVFISGIGTDVGKSVVSAYFLRQTGWDYWKPIQTGMETDSPFVKKYMAKEAIIHPEKFHFSLPASPHLSAEKEGKEISLSDFSLPEFNRPTLIEGAGGLQVPLNYSGELISDLIKWWNIPLVMVIRHYLGSINHSILSLEKAASLSSKVLVVFNGTPNPGSEKVIKNCFPELSYLHLPELNLNEPESWPLIDLKLLYELV